jgi:predicted nuclease with TOPRIM domain
MTEKDEGKLIATLETIAGTLSEVKGDVKGILRCQAKTEERLSHGVGHFSRVDGKLDEHDKAINKMPSGKVVYTVLGLGFTILGLLVAVLR